MQTENKKLSDSITEYNEYVYSRLKLIMDFDIWYENTNGTTFPKEWYELIKNRQSEMAG